MIRLVIKVALLVLVALHGLSLCHAPCETAGDSCHERGLACVGDVRGEQVCEEAGCADWQWPAGGVRVSVEMPVGALPAEALVAEGVRGRDWREAEDLRVGCEARVGVGCGLPLLF